LVAGGSPIASATSLADQADHGHVGCGVSRHHPEQNALADA
jgi:hypothetical protein